MTIWKADRVAMHERKGKSRDDGARDQALVLGAKGGDDGGRDRALVLGAKGGGVKIWGVEITFYLQYKYLVFGETKSKKLGAARGREDHGRGNPWKRFTGEGRAPHPRDRDRADRRPLCLLATMSHKSQRS
ncbi:unnamed protein product [Calypogeia fissa]